MDELAKLQARSKYLFHGSIRGDLEMLEPRQARSHGNPDGKPCVAATERIEPAIFMAVLGSRHTGGWGKGKIERGQFGFYIKSKDYYKARQEEWRGYVYLLERMNFEHTGAWEWRAFTPVHPIKCIEVGFADLPKHIQLED